MVSVLLFGTLGKSPPPARPSPAARRLPARCHVGQQHGQQDGPAGLPSAGQHRDIAGREVTVPQPQEWSHNAGHRQGTDHRHCADSGLFLAFRWAFLVELLSENIDQSQETCGRGVSGLRIGSGLFASGCGQGTTFARMVPVLGRGTWLRLSCWRSGRFGFQSTSNLYPPTIWMSRTSTSPLPGESR